ncbi:hypothetical protein PanWU01x14_262950 [Parasponia andersonii]|uniref:Uncharacterized protein n=1 Tax=Parasponia andersonii TaxID=3476 RepID=A0A2P5B802_PARAD|nr:hypothetical protein PanWU01x14_262950 [Parasponia andersonii]
MEDWKISEKIRKKIKPDRRLLERGYNTLPKELGSQKMLSESFYFARARGAGHRREKGSFGISENIRGIMGMTGLACGISLRCDIMAGDGPLRLSHVEESELIEYSNS